MCGAPEPEQKFVGRRLDGRQGLWPKWKAGLTTSILQCRQCALLYANPMPVPETIEEHYDMAPEAFWAEDYVQDSSNTMGAFIDQVRRLAGSSLPASPSMLDIGAGLGKAMVAFRQAGFDVHGVEPSPSFHREAIKRTGFAADRLQLSSVEAAMFPSNAFDFVNLSAVLEHVTDPDAVMRKATEWLKPGGLAFVEVPSSAFLLSRLVRLFYRGTGVNFVINTCPMHPPYHLYEFGLESFVKHGARAGYTVVTHHYEPCAGYMPRWMIGPFNAVMRWTDTGMQLMVWLRKNPR
jgi:SAM-dependent methyltransferase